MRRTDLCERGLVDAVDVRLGLLLDVISEGFVTDGAVDQRLHERTRTKQHKGRVRAGARPTFKNLSFRLFFNDEKTHPVVSELTRGGVDGSFRTGGGFKVEVVIDVFHVKTGLGGRKEGGLGSNSFDNSQLSSSKSSSRRISLRSNHRILKFQEVPQ